MKKTFKNFMAIAILAMTFAACEDVPEPYYVFAEDNTPSTVVESTGSGTVDDPFNVAAAIAKCQEIGTEQSAESYYIKGIVVSGGTADAQYGNASFYIADSQDGGDMFYCFQVLGSGGAKLPAGYTINIGDEVVVYGPIYNYKGNTPETAGKGAAYIVTINGKATNDTSGGEQAASVGSKEDPKTVAEALTAINAMADNTTSNEYWYVTGKVIRVTTNQSNFDKYGNLNYLISADGTESENTLTIYSGDGLNGEKFTGIDALKAGDEVIVYGQLQKYKNANTGAVTPEMAKGNYLVYYKSGDGSTPAPQPTGEAWGVATSVSDGQYAIAAQKDGSSYVIAQTLTSNYGYLKTSDATASDNKLSPVASNNIFTIKTTTGGYTIQDADNKYLYMTGTYNSFNRSDDMPAEGAVWSITFNNDGTANIVNNAMGKTLQYSAQYSSYGAYTDISNTLPYLLVKDGNGTLNGGTGGNGNDNPNPQPSGQGGTLSGNVLTVNAAEFGLPVEGNATTATLTDGTMVTFSKGTGSSEPKFYSGDYASVRVYANNTITIEGKKKIASVFFTTTAPNNTTTYNGSELAYANEESNKVTKEDETHINFNGQNLQKITIVNFSEKNSGNQLRISQMVITFAE